MSDVLIVDDSAVDRRYVAGLLKHAGFDVQVASGAPEALRILGQEPARLIVADLMMPEIDGAQLVEEVRANYPLVPVILMTSQGNEKHALRALRHGAASYVPKRLLADELVDTVRHVLNVASGRQSHSRVMHCLDLSVFHFRLENDCQLVTPLVGYLQETVGYLDLCTDADRTRIGIALEEALVNAIFHGNLEVESSLKEQDDEAYRDLIETRRRQSPYQDRHVAMEARLSRAEARFTISDQGPGFDPQSLPDPTDPANLDRVCGRGVLLMRTFMDEVSFNDRGNVVTLVKKRCLPDAH